MTATLCKAGGLGVILPIGEIVGKWPRSAVVKREGVEISPPTERGHGSNVLAECKWFVKPAARAGR